MSNTEKTRWPRGITIYRLKSDKHHPLRASIKSGGRTGAWVRQHLQTLSAEQQQPILAAWLRGEVA